MSQIPLEDLEALNQDDRNRLARNVYALLDDKFPSSSRAQTVESLDRTMGRPTPNPSEVPVDEDEISEEERENNDEYEADERKYSELQDIVLASSVLQRGKQVTDDIRLARVLCSLT